MEEALNSSLGIYRIIYLILNSTSSSVERSFVAIIFITFGWFSFEPRRGRPIGFFRFFWYFFLVTTLAAFQVETATHEQSLLWLVYIGFMLKFAYSKLYQNEQL